MISLDKTCSGNQNKLFFLCEYSFWPEFYKNYQKLSGHAISQLLQSLTQTLWILIRGWKQGQESHYIQPNNLSSALIVLFANSALKQRKFLNDSCLLKSVI